MAADPVAMVLAAHVVGDWLVQTDWQANTKAWVPGSQVIGAQPPLPPTALLTAEGVVIKGKLTTRAALVRKHWWLTWRANQLHMLSYHLLLAFALLPVGWTLGRCLLTLAVSWATHSVIDRRWTVRWLLSHTGSAKFAQLPWGVLAADQALHLGILMLLVAW